MKYLIIGKEGQLGKEFIKVFEKKGIGYIGLNHHELDISRIEDVVSCLESIRPDIVINAAAYNQVDLAEKNFDLAFKTNALGVHNLLFAGKKIKALLIHYSTDYVFDGKKENGYYTEEDLPNPISEYGKSKYLGETFISQDLENSLLFRSSWVFGDGKQNFIYKFLEWSKKNNILKVTCDEVSIPTHTKIIADVTLKAIAQETRGLFHITNSSYCSRYELAKFIARSANLKNIIYPVPIESFNLSAKRPPFSPMDNKKISRLLNINIPSWEESVKDYINSL
jgi:dTDP-4-dehydrorhamnose reductase